MKRSRGLLCRRELLVLSGLMLIVAACGKSISSLETLAPTATPKSTNTPIPNTPLPTDTPTPEPSPTISPTPDWESMDNTQLLERAPRKEGYAKESVVGHDTGRYVTYRNQESGRVEWVFNTEVREFERGAESVWRPVVGENGETAEIRTLVVTSKELEEMFHGYFKIDQEDEEKLSRYVAVNCAVNWYSQLNPERFQDTASMSDAQKRALVEESLAQYLQQVIRTGSRIELHGQDVSSNQMIFKFDYRQGSTGIRLLADENVPIRHVSSSGPDDNYVMKLLSGQNLLSYVEAQGENESYEVYNTRAYWAHGPLVWMGNLIGETSDIFGRAGIYDEEQHSSLFPQIIQTSFGEGNYYPITKYPWIINSLDYPGLPSLHGDWLVGDWVSGSNR